MRALDAAALVASNVVDVNVATSKSSRLRSPLPSADRFRSNRGDAPCTAN
ncbi:hypothetical protein BURMUCF2_A1871 [Burkholderia multivorans CF2]|nr:hypothetical protein BURMUCF2_A1871 [Burkholderia multivorans CF2]